MINATIRVNTGPRVRENAIDISANVQLGLLEETAIVSIA